MKGNIRQKDGQPMRANINGLNLESVNHKNDLMYQEEQPEKSAHANTVTPASAKRPWNTVDRDWVDGSHHNTPNLTDPVTTCQLCRILLRHTEFYGSHYDMPVLMDLPMMFCL